MYRIKDREPIFTTGTGCGGFLQYKIVRTNDPFCREGKDTVYSIAAVCVDKEYGSSSFFAYDVTRDLSRAAKLAGKLCRCKVFPENLPEVLADAL